jgi:hypothetical protein
MEKTGVSTADKEAETVDASNILELTWLLSGVVKT